MTFILTLAVCLLFTVSVYAQQLAFPSALGWGRFAKGGRGGVVCHVNTTSATSTTGGLIGGTGPHYEGSYRYCASILSVPRTIVFDVGGTIANTNDSDIRIEDPFLTIAAQTAPGDGILIKHMMHRIMTNDVIVRNLRIRHGLNFAPQNEGDCMMVWTNGQDVIIDHSSFSWNHDEVANSFGSSAQRITWQWNIMAESLRGQPLLSGGTTVGRGFLLGGATTNNTWHHNLLMSHFDRNPNLKAGNMDIINNLIYNFQNFMNIAPDQGVIHANIVKNYFKEGPEETAGKAIRLEDGQANNTGSAVYLLGNIHADRTRPDNTFPENSLAFHLTGGAVLTETGTRYATHPGIGAAETDAFQAYTDVILKSGARVPSLDDVDTRLLNEVQTNQGQIINDPADVGGYPTLNSGTPPTDTDKDGIPDSWESTCNSSFSGSTTGGLSASDANDGGEILDWSSPTEAQAALEGYSKLEIYLNELMGDYTSGTCGGLNVEDTTDPTNVVITNPSNNGTVSGTSVSICSTADDETGMSKVEFYIDGGGIPVGTDTTEVADEWCITWDSTTVADGNRTIFSRAFDISDNSTDSSSITVNVDNIPAYTAIHTASAPTINGNISEFANANLIEFNGGGGNETDCKMMYDSTNLYVGCVTTDSNLTATVTTSDNSSIISDDSLEIVLDPDNSGGSWTSSDYKLIVNVQDAVYDVHTLSNTAWSYGGAVDASFVGDLDGVADDTSWTVEVRIPWSSIGVTPSTSVTYAINLQINDKDGTATTTRYRWNGTSANNLADAMDVMLGEPSGDTTDPTVSITAPLDGATIGGTYTIRADAQDASGILDVQFYRDTSTAICAADTVAPFECVFDSTGISEGSHTFHAVARDNVSPTPNDATSATVTVTVDNTPTSAPTGLSLVPSYTDDGYVIFIDWDDVTGAVSYEIERCDGTSCSDFELISTELISSYLDDLISRKTEYCYRVRALDIASNPSSYSSTVCDLSLDTIVLDEPTSLSTTHSSTVAALGGPSSLTTTHFSSITTLSGPSSLATTHNSSVTVLGQPSGLGTP